MEKILVVNNDIDTMTLIKELLERRAYSVKYTGSGDESLLIAKSFNPDLLLIDILHKNIIPDFKSHPETASIPILMMTGYTWCNDDINKTKADHLIEKPFLMEELEEKIEQSIKIGVQVNEV